MRWYKSHKIGSTILAVVLIVVVLTIISFATNDNFILFRGIRSITYTVLEPISKLSTGTKSAFDALFNYHDVKSENVKLAEENRQLQLENAALKANQEKTDELKTLSEGLNYKNSGQITKVVTGDIITQDGSIFGTSFTINVGKDDGISEGDSVIYGAGLVGKVDQVGKGWAKITTIVDETSKVTFAIEGRLSVMGVISTSTDGQLKGYLIDKNQSVSEGETLLTTGLGIYPAGLKIGRVTKVVNNSDASMAEIYVKPSVNFSSIKRVTVVK